MAGTVLYGNNVDGSEGSYFAIQVATQDVASNQSLINWQMGWHFVATSCRGLRQGRANINGINVYYNYNSGDGVHTYNSGHRHKPQLQIASGSIWIGHAADGTGWLNLYVTMTGWQGLVSTGQVGYTLPTIPRFSSAPSTPVISDIRQNSVYVTFSDGTGGAPIQERHLGWGTSPTPNQFMISDGSDTVSGLSPATTYYFSARTLNTAGWSPWSGVSSATTLAGANINVSGTWHDAVPYVNVNGVWRLARPWVKSDGIWKPSV